MKRVDIILPVYNAEIFLPETLNAIATQTYPMWTLWVVNDGSTDRSLEIIWNFARVIGDFPGSFQRVKVFNGHHQGVSAARNYAKDLIMQWGEGELIALVDSDDIWRPTHLWRSVEHFDKHPDIDFFYSDCDFKFSDGSKAFPYGIEQHPFLNPIYTSTVMFKKKCFSVGDFDSRIEGREDWDMWVRMKNAGYVFYYLNEILTVYTVRSNGVAGTWNEEKNKIFNDKRWE